MAFKSVQAHFNLVELEDAVSSFWKEHKTFEKSISSRPEDNRYTFVDGPPFVTGIPHYGSLLPSIAKDVVPRYQTMLGKRVRRVFGWDCHGLPIEEKVNALFGIKSSSELEEKLGVERYVKECRKYVQQASDNWRWYIDKIGRWVDMDHAYYTMSIEFMESVIWAFKQIYEKGLIYKGKRVSLFSTDTSTPVSNFEVAMDQDNYRDVEDLAVFVKFEVANLPKFLEDKELQDKPLYLVAWTTTPWTIPANFALAVNKDFIYSLIEYEKEYLIVAKDRLAYTFNLIGQEVGPNGDSLVKIIAEFPGTELEGVKYLPIYKQLAPDNSNDYKVYLSPDVTFDEGTGVLHIAPAFGEVDFLMGQKYGISGMSDIDDEGKMTVKPWVGLYLRDASSLIAEDMQSSGHLLRSHFYVHRLPFYRGANPLIYMAQDAYFIDIQKIKSRMIELSLDTNWIPEHIKKGRFLHTLETSPDWCISRNRYWATIMPIWQSGDGEELVIGSLEEMSKYCRDITKKDGKYFFKEEPLDLHRDVCDRIVLEKEGKKYHRVPEVLDCWLDSGSAPFAEYHYPFENKEIFEASQPADFIIEYVGQVRAWFNVLLRLSTMLFDKEAFTNVICTGVLAGNDGRKMSKSFGNYPDPKMVLEKYGGDALRLYLMSSPVMKGEDVNFYEEGVAENYKFLLMYWNSYKFFIDYANVFDWDCHKVDHKVSKLNILDKWILAKLTQLVLDTRKALDHYDLPLATKSLKDFLVNDFSTWYIRRSRDRVSSNDNVADRDLCLSVLYGVLVTYTKLLAPIAPFITESIYRNLTDDESVHLTDYPGGDKSLLDPQLIKDMQLVRVVVEEGHAKRKEVSIKLRQPLSQVTYTAPMPLSTELEQIIAEELNVKKVEYLKGENLLVTIETTITSELAKEGEARELIRQIQQMRKDMKLTLNDKIVVTVPSWPKDYEAMILKMTNAKVLTPGENLGIEIV